MIRVLFTVFTPTFNRAHTLHRVYESLRNQTCQNFEWIIVDDGSTDHTHELVTKWKRDADFPIRYFWQENKGKHVAFNRGVQEALGVFFLPFDSDDACVPEALERFKYYWDLIPNNNKYLFTGVSCLCQDQHGKLVGNKYPYAITDSDSLEIYFRYRVRGEKWGFHRCDILRRYPFPSVDHATYVPESIIWNTIAKSFKTRFINEVLRIYFIQEIFSSDQITHSLSNPAKNAGGSLFYYQFCLNNEIKWLQFNPAHFLFSAINYIRFSLHLKKGLFVSLEGVCSLLGKVLVILTFPFGVVAYSFDKKNITPFQNFRFIFLMLKKWSTKLFTKINKKPTK